MHRKPSAGLHNTLKHPTPHKTRTPPRHSALSLPAALFVCVCQAAFRSLLDLRTPLLVVGAANAANLVLDELLMFRLGLGMAGCGWASVAALYLGAAVFAALVWRRRDFGLHDALDAAAAAAAAEAARHGGGGGAWGEAGGVGGGGGGAGGAGAGAGAGRRLKRRSVDLERNDARWSRGSGGRGSARGSMESGAGGFGGDSEDDGGGGGGGGGGAWARHRRESYSDGGGGGGYGGRDGGHGDFYGTGLGAAHLRGRPGSSNALATVASSGGLGGLGGGDGGSGSLKSSPLRPRGGAYSRAAAAPPLSPRAALAAQRFGPSGGSRGRERERALAAAAVAGVPLARKAAALLRSLRWAPFLRQFGALSVRGCLILTTYTGASVVAARAGAAATAAHQVLAQQQQLQMSVAWSALHVAQVMG